ncbi:MAG TPA: hypothetical protein VN843_24110 [Anaerolineales bacterium]|nr:hypothetical protein [Anaerolineales bacterium]
MNIIISTLIIFSPYLYFLIGYCYAVRRQKRRDIDYLSHRFPLMRLMWDIITWPKFLLRGVNSVCDKEL